MHDNDMWANELRGIEFANFAAHSLLAKKLVSAGFSIKVGSEVYDKDYGCDDNGAPMIEYFDCGELALERNGVKAHLYQSRFSDAWALDVKGGRTTLTASLADLEKLNDESFVNDLLNEVETYAAN